MEVLVVNKEEVDEILTMDKCVRIMSDTFEAHAGGKSLQPLRSAMKLPSRKGLLGMMPGYTGNHHVMGIKAISVFPENYKAGLSSHQGIILLFESENGKLLAIVDGEAITATRTAAVSAIATRALARKDASKLAILGAGVQGRAHLQSIPLVRGVKEVRVWDIDFARAEQLAKTESKSPGVSIAAVDTARDAVETADIICTVTPAQEPILEAEWVRSGAHINAVGACTPDARELDSALVARSRLFADNRESLFNESADFLIPLREGLYGEEHLQGELGDLLAGKRQGRESSRDITLFKSLGLAIEDVSAGFFVYQEAKKRNLGTSVVI
jgi:ornithine cyclodeaminase